VITRAASTQTQRYQNKMKVMDSRSGLGANRRHSFDYGKDLQRRHVCEDALSCFDISVSEY
jgi:hypothetical protein